MLIALGNFTNSFFYFFFRLVVRIEPTGTKPKPLTTNQWDYRNKGIFFITFIVIYFFLILTDSFFLGTILAISA